MALRIHSSPLFYDPFDAFDVFDHTPLSLALLHRELSNGHNGNGGGKMAKQQHSRNGNSQVEFGYGTRGGGLKVDVVESEKEWAVKTDLPGVDMKDVELQVANGVLYISAHRSQTHEEKTEYSHRIERSYGSVKRGVAIPENALADTADASFENGVLTVSFTKKPLQVGGEPRKLTIRGGTTTEGPDTSISASQAADASSST